MINITEEIENKPITLNELAEQNAGKLFQDDSVRDSIVKVADKTVQFSFKPIRKKHFIKGQATQDEEKFMNYILTHSLWNKEKGENGDFWTLEELNKGIPDAWQVLLFGQIIVESGFKFDPKDLGF